MNKKIITFPILDSENHETWLDPDYINGMRQGYNDCVAGRIVEMPDSFWAEADKLIEQNCDTQE